MIFGMSRRDNEESVNPFMKSKMIAGNSKSIFAKIKNTFEKIKNQNDLSVHRFWNLENIFFVPKNRFPGNNLQENVNKLKLPRNILKIYGNILKKGIITRIIPGNKLQSQGNVLQNAGNKLKKQEGNLKILGDRLIFLETFREVADIPDCGGEHYLWGSIFHQKLPLSSVSILIGGDGRLILTEIDRIT